MNTPKVHVIQEGERRWSYADSGGGLPLLLVHGFPLTRQMWQAQLGGLASSLHGIAVDLPGCGGSNLLAEDCSAVTGGDAVTMETLSDRLASFVECCGIDRPLVFCGLSMGGYIAWQFWARHRELLAGLILCDTRAAADGAEAAAARRAMADAVLRDGIEPIAETMLPRLLAPGTASSRPDLVELVRKMIVETQPRTIALLQRAMAVRADARPWLESIDVPALVVVGEDDAISPVEEMRQMATRMPQAELAIVPGAGHLAPLENPRFVNQRIAEFCGRLG